MYNERLHTEIMVEMVYVSVKNETWYCRDRVSPCNIYAVQQDTQSFF